MPPAGVPRPAQAGHRRLRGVARGGARPRRRGASESGPHRAVSSPESRGIPERHPRPAGARHRRRHAAAGRRGELRLRQHRGRVEALAAADRALSQRRSESGAAGAGHAARRRMATCIAFPTSSIRTCASRACRLGRAAAPASTTSRRETASTIIKARIGRGIDYDIPHFIGEQNLEISVDGERVQMFTLPATPEERSQHRAPGVQGARHGASARRTRRRQRRRDPRRGGARAENARRQLGDSQSRSRPACTRFAPRS